MAAVGDGAAARNGGGGGREQQRTVVKNGDVAVYPPYYREAARGGDLPMFVRQGDIEYPFEDTTGAGNENKMRGNWPASYDFALAALAFAVGLGNLWRFPYYCHWHGGVAFFIPFLVAMVILVAPLAMLECAVAQFCSLGCVALWKLCPLFKGIGVTMLAASCVMAIYTNMATAWSVYYLIASAGATLPWAHCRNAWNSADCVDYSKRMIDACGNGTLLLNGTCIQSVRMGDIDSTLNTTLTSLVMVRPADDADLRLPSEDYFYKRVIRVSSSIDEFGTIHWELALYLLVAWIIVFLCNFKGVESMGRVVYVSGTLPYVLLIVLMVRALTLPGGTQGLIQLASPRWECLLDIRTWGNAFVACLGSLCLGWGGLHTLASYSRFHANVRRNVALVCAGCVLSACVAVAAAFAALGALAEEAGMRPDKLVRNAVDQVFIAWPELLARLQVAPLWSAVFFVLVVTLALDTQMVLVHTTVTAICDAFPERLRKNDRHVLACVCVVFYFAGVSLCSSAGVHVIALLDYYVRTWTVLLVATGEVLALAWIYGADNVLDNVKWISGQYPAPYIVWKVLWKWVVPLALLAVLTFVWYDYTPVRHAAATAHLYPLWADAVGWVVGLAPVIIVPLTALFQFIFVAKGTCLSRLQELLSPADDWGPALAVHRAEQYPLQMPEARPAIRRPQDRRVISDDLYDYDDDDDDAMYDEDERYVDARLVQHDEPLVRPADDATRFDRETAI